MHRHEHGTEPFERGATKKKLETLAAQINARFDEAERRLEEKKRSIPGVVEVETELDDAGTAARKTREALLRFPATTLAGMAAAFEYCGQLADRHDLGVDDEDDGAAIMKAVHGTLRRLAV